MTQTEMGKLEGIGSFVVEVTGMLQKSSSSNKDMGPASLASGNDSQHSCSVIFICGQEVMKYIYRVHRTDL